MYILIHICIHIKHTHACITHTTHSSTNLQQVRFDTDTGYHCSSLLDRLPKKPKKNHFKLETACYCNSLAAAESNQ